MEKPMTETNDSSEQPGRSVAARRIRVERLVGRCLTVTRMARPGKWHGWVGTIMPGTRMALGWAWCIADDGAWTAGGKVLAGYRRTEKFRSLIWRKWQLKLRWMGYLRAKGATANGELCGPAKGVQR